MPEENPRGEEADKPNHIRVRVFEKGCNIYKIVK
jgi:hypothetical protein